MTPTNDRQKVLNFTQPYYYTPAVVVVNGDNTDVKDLSTDLDGKKIGVCAGCTYEQYLNKTLAIEGFTSTSSSTTPRSPATTPTPRRCRTWPSVTAPPRRRDHVTHDRPGLHRRRQPGEDRRRPGVLRAAGRRRSTRARPDDPTASDEAVDEIVADMHEDGTLTELSEKWYGGT